jgi:pyrroline-5-carboxylate reductase
MNTKIRFFGAGNMASAMVKGLITRGFEAQSIAMSDPNLSTLEYLASQYPIITTTENTAYLDGFDIFILAVKPQVIMMLLDQIAGRLPKNALVLSIAAGVTTSQIAQKLGRNTAIVRCMPNTPAIVHVGATGLFASPSTSESHKQVAYNIMSAIGMSIWLSEEAHIDAVTALSGSGPAYFFLVMEKMIAAGIQMGLSADVAKQLCLQTALGSAQLAITSSDSPHILRKNVTSPNGTTERAISVLEQHNLGAIFESALFAAKKRAQELSTEIVSQENLTLTKESLS